MCLTVSTADDSKNGFSLPLYTRLFPFHSFYFSKLFHYVCLKYVHCLGKTKARTRTNQAPQYVVLELKIKVGERRAAAESSCPALSFGRCAVHKAEEMLLSLPLVLGTLWAPQGCHSSSSSAWSPCGWGRSSLQGHGGAEPAALPGDTSGLCLQSTWLWSGSLRAHLADEMRLFSAPPALVQDAGRHCCGQRVEGSWNKLLPKGKGKERNTGLHEKDTTTQEISLKLCSLELRQLKEGTNKQKQTPHHQRAPKPLPQLLCPLELLSKPGSPVCIMQERGIPALPELQTTLTPHISPFPKQGPSLAPCSQLGFT